MRIQKFTTVAVALVAAQWMWTAPAQATLISDVQNINATLSYANPTYSSAAHGTSFDLTDSGVPTTSQVTAAVVSFTLMDVDGMIDVVSANIGGDALYGISNPFGFSAFGGLLSGSVVSGLNVSGILDYTLNFVLGLGSKSSVTVSQGMLVADVKSVPEPGTLSLLGAGLLAGWLGRKRMARSA